MQGWSAVPAPMHKTDSSCLPDALAWPASKPPLVRSRSLEAATRGAAEQTPEAVPSPGVPVFVMLPLDTITAEGLFRYATTAWFHQALATLANSGVHGVAVDVWVRCAHPCV